MCVIARRTVCVCVLLAIPATAHAWHFDYRFVERVGFVDTVLATGTPFNGTPGVPTRLRIQFGVFDDAVSAAPAGGFIAWNVGTITDSVTYHNNRTPGRLPPFNFAAGPGANGLPSADPFQAITDISTTLGTQDPFWGLDPLGVPLPMPQPQIRGLNAFISTFEITTIPGNQNYSITVGGNLVAASGWNVVGTPVPPDNNGTPLDPTDDIPGQVTYAPFPLPPQSFLLPPLVLDIVVPSPGSGLALVALVFALPCKRRRS